MAVTKRRLIADILGDVQRDDNDNVIGVDTNLSVDLVNPHIVPDLLYPAYNGIAGNGDSLLAGYTWGDVHTPTGKRYFFTQFTGRNPIVDPRSGSHVGTSRHMMKTAINMGNEALEDTFNRIGDTAVSGQNITGFHNSYSIDGRDWMRISSSGRKSIHYPPFRSQQSSQSQNATLRINDIEVSDTHGSYVELDTQSTFEVTFYGSGLNFLLHYDRNSTSTNSGIQGAYTAVNMDAFATVNRPMPNVGPLNGDSNLGVGINDRVRFESIRQQNPIAVATKDLYRDALVQVQVHNPGDINSMTLGINTIIYRNVSDLPLRIYGIETVVDQTNINIPSQTVVTSGRRVTTTTTNKEIKTLCGWETSNPGYGQGTSFTGTHTKFDGVNGEYDEGLDNQWDGFLQIAASAGNFSDGNSIAPSSNLNINDYVVDTSVTPNRIRRVIDFNQTFAGINGTDKQGQINQATNGNQCIFEDVTTVAAARTAATAALAALTGWTVGETARDTTLNRVYKILQRASSTTTFVNCIFAYAPPHNGGRKLEYVTEGGSIHSATNWMPRSASAYAANTSAAVGGIIDSRAGVGTLGGQSKPLLNNTAITLSRQDNVANYNYREFSNGVRNNTQNRSDRLGFTNMDNGSYRACAWCLDDNLTSLVGTSVVDTGDGAIYVQAGSDLFLTFIGTGLEIEYPEGLGEIAPQEGISRQDAGIITGIGNTNNPSASKKLPIVSGLPYGTHVLRISRGNPAVTSDSPIVGEDISLGAVTRDGSGGSGSGNWVGSGTPPFDTTLAPGDIIYHSGQAGIPSRVTTITNSTNLIAIRLDDAKVGGFTGGTGNFPATVWRNGKTDYYIDGSLVLDKNTLAFLRETTRDNINHYLFRGCSIYQPSKPSIPRSLAVVGDHMIMANYVPCTNNGAVSKDSQSLISQGVRKVSGQAGELLWDSDEVINYFGQGGSANRKYTDNALVLCQSAANQQDFAGDTSSSGSTNFSDGINRFTTGLPDNSFSVQDKYPGGFPIGVTKFTGGAVQRTSFAYDGWYGTGIEVNMVNFVPSSRTGQGVTKDNGGFGNSIHKIIFDEPTRKNGGSEFIVGRNYSTANGTTNFNTQTAVLNTRIFDAGDGTQTTESLANGHIELIHPDAQGTRADGSTVTNIAVNKSTTPSRKHVFFRHTVDATFVTTGVNVITPIHKSNHYERLNTKYSNDLIAGGDGIDSGNLVVSTDGTLFKDIKAPNQIQFPSAGCHISRSFRDKEGGGMYLLGTTVFAGNDIRIGWTQVRGLNTLETNNAKEVFYTKRISVTTGVRDGGIYFHESGYYRINVNINSEGSFSRLTFLQNGTEIKSASSGWFGPATSQIHNEPFTAQFTVPFDVVADTGGTVSQQRRTWNGSGFSSGELIHYFNVGDELITEIDSNGITNAEFSAIGKGLRPQDFSNNLGSSDPIEKQGSFSLDIEKIGE